MGRGLGTRQWVVLKALRTLEREHGPGWRTPGEVLAVVDRMTGAGRNPALEHIDRADRAQLAHLRDLVGQGDPSFRPSVQAIEGRIAAREAQQRREKGQRAPNTLRREPRAGEDGNPSRVLETLARRGLVERQAHCGPGSVVRLLG